MSGWADFAASYDDHGGWASFASSYLGDDMDDDMDTEAAEGLPLPPIPEELPKPELKPSLDADELAQVTKPVTATWCQPLFLGPLAAAMDLLDKAAGNQPRTPSIEKLGKHFLQNKVALHTTKTALGQVIGLASRMACAPWAVFSRTLTKWRDTCWRSVSLRAMQSWWHTLTSTNMMRLQ